MGGLGPKNKHGERGLSCACEKERSARRVPSSREGPLGMKCFTRGFAAEAQPPHKPDVQGSLLDRPSAWARQPPRSLVTAGGQQATGAAQPAVLCSRPSLPFLRGTPALPCPFSGPVASCRPSPLGWPARRLSVFGADRGSSPRWADRKAAEGVRPSYPVGATGIVGLS